MSSYQRINTALYAFEQLPPHSRIEDCETLEQVAGLWIDGTGSIEAGIKRVSATLSGQYLDLMPFTHAWDLLAFLESIVEEDDYDPTIAQGMIRTFKQRRNPPPPMASDEEIDAKWLARRPLPTFWPDALERFCDMMPPGGLVYDDDAGPGLNAEIFLHRGYSYIGHESIAWDQIPYHGERRSGEYDLALRRTGGKNGTVTDKFCLFNLEICRQLSFDGYWQELATHMTFTSGSIYGKDGGIFRRLRGMASRDAPLFISVDTTAREIRMEVNPDRYDRFISIAEERGWKLVESWLKDFKPHASWDRPFRGYLFKAT